MRYLLGVDGGGTKTILVITDEFGKILGISRTDSVDILNVPKGEVKEKLRNALDEVLHKAKIESGDIELSCFGMSTFGDVPGVEVEIESLVKSILPQSFVVNDVRVALEGAHPDSAGMILLAGTGAMAMAKNKNGEIFRVDGWGEYVGDIGSGYFVGRMILQRAFEEYDGRSEQTPILNMVKNFAGVSDLREILTKCKGSNVRAYVANFSKIACQAADNGVKEAMQILSVSVKELVRSVSTLVKKLDFEPIPLAYAGGLFNCRHVKDEFTNLIKNMSQVKVVEAEFPPYIGAVIMAAKQILNSEEWLVFYDGLHKDVKELYA